jgi:hypothetical protein
MGHPRYSADDIGRRGEAIYEQRLRAVLEEGNRGKVLVIDIETGDYELGDDELILARRLRSKNPDAALYGMRIGYPSLARVGGGWGAASR